MPPTMIPPDQEPPANDSPPARIAALERLIAAFGEIVAREEATVAAIEAGAAFHRNSIVDITVERLHAARRTLAALRSGTRELERTRSRLLAQAGEPSFGAP